MASKRPQRPSEFLTATQTAVLFGVTPRTVVRWAKDGQLPSIRTLGGHRRFRRADVAELYEVLMGAPMPEAAA